MIEVGEVLTQLWEALGPDPERADERGVTHRWQLADRTVRLHLTAKGAKRHGRKTITLRQIVRLSPDGHQTHILTSRHDLPAGEIAARMFNRWRQENYFRYARQHFALDALDALDSYAAIDDDPDRTVPNPAKRAAGRRVRELQQVVADAEATLGRHRNSRGLSASCDELDTTLDEVRSQLNVARQAAADTPARVPLAEVAPDARLLDTETKLLTHACRIAAYNAESTLARLAGPHYACANDEARSLIREALTTAGDLQLADSKIHVTLNPLSAPRRTRALAAICQLLNDTQTVYPGTDLVLSYSVKPHPSAA